MLRQLALMRQFELIGGLLTMEDWAGAVPADHEEDAIRPVREIKLDLFASSWSPPTATPLLR